MITGIYEFGIFWSKNGRFVTHICFSKNRPWNPYFYSVFWGARFLGQVVKKGKFWTPTQKRRKFSLITEKLIFGYFLCFLVFFFFFFFFLFLFFCLFCFFFLCFFGGGSGEVARRATSLGPKPSLFVFFVCFLLVFFFFLVHFLSLFLIEKPCFPPQKGHFFVFSQCFPFFLPSLFSPPPFSLSLSLSLCFSFLSSFLLVFLFRFLFVSCFGLFFSFSFFCAFVSWKEQHRNIQLESFSSSILSHFCWFPLFFFLTNSLSLSLFFSWF